MLNSIQEENPRFRGDGFSNLSVLYASYALSICLLPPVMNVLGPKCTLALGAMGFCVPLVALLLEHGWLVYVSSVCNGVSAALLWSSQIVFIMLNSVPSTIARNSAIFTGLCHSSMVYGNLFVYFCFAGKSTIDRETRIWVLSGLLGFTVLASLIASFMPSPVYIKEHEKYQVPALQTFKQSWAVATTKNMLILTPMFFYTGLQLSYLSGIFGAAVGFTTYSGGFPSNQMVPLTGIFTGVGEVLCGMFLSFINPLLSRRSWALIVILGVTCDCVVFLLSFLSYSNNSVSYPTTDTTIISSRPWTAVVCAVLLGFSDGLFMPMLLTLMKKIYPHGDASTVTGYSFCFGVGAAMSFIFSDFAGLHWQLLVNTIGGIIGVLCYFYVSRVNFSLN